MNQDIQILIAIEQLLDYATKNLSLDKYDIHYTRNALLDNFKLGATAPQGELPAYDDIQDVVDFMIDYAIAKGLTTEDERLLYETRIFGIVTPAPSSIILKYDITEAMQGVESATDYLYDLSCANNYLRLKDINKNIMWDYKGSRGDLVVTINLSKPEKDPKQIAAALKAKTGYPACMLCPSNVGYAGNAAHPARQTLRTIPVTLNGEQWWIQFSPYQYYSKHLIAFCDEHRPMKVNHDCIARLVDFVDQFPHFFMGSNAALPIVGGSILTHDHYQGGGKSLPMFKAPVRKAFKSPIKGASIEIVDWYNSVVRVSSKKKLVAIETANYVLEQWFEYSDESVNILCKTDAQHNAVTPIARYEDDKYIIDMILRNNRTDEAHPYGIYHPTEDLHNIKKEGIGIIEVMGTFILPGRLDKELKAIQEYLTGKVAFNYEEVANENHPLTKHKDMIKTLIEKNGTANSEENAKKAVTDYINNACEQILECTAVFKNNEQGRNAFDKFMIEGLGCKACK